MPGRTVDLYDIVSQDQLATSISSEFTRWDSLREGWRKEKQELRNYIFATDTTKTTNSQLPWKNSTTIPKLCQIRDNLHANYLAAMFPNEDWLVWEGDDREAEQVEKRKTIEAYMKNKVRASNFQTTVSQLLYDYIDFGNVVATSSWVAETHDNGEEVIAGYTGPAAQRISPLDIVFNPTAAKFQNAPKIIRSIITIGELQLLIQENPENQYLQTVFDEMIDERKRMSEFSRSDNAKAEGFAIDGFGSMLDYYGSGYVELLELHGDYFDVQANKLYKNHIITVVDRTKIIRKIPDPSWMGKGRFQHAGWRLRPDNLWAMGPLDNLVGMQYRIDHLENLKADVFDLIAHPLTLVQGEVEDFDYGPGERIYLGDEGSVTFSRPDTTALNADTQIAILEQKMEEMAGAPKNAMGIRTPGEKTKFEVQTLENAAGRIFQNKIKYFEQEVIEPLLNQMLAEARRRMDSSEVVRVLDDETDVVLFETITKEDITANGKLRPVGSRHFAKRANLMQNLVQLSASPLGADPAVNVHISGLGIAKIIEELLGIEKFGIVSENIRVLESQETQQIAAGGAPTPEEEDTVGEVPLEQEGELSAQAGPPLV